MMMQKKIIVIDSGGEEHIFNEIPREVEMTLAMQDDSVHPIVITKTFDVEHGDNMVTETESTFFAPRRIDVLYVRR